MTTKPDFDLNNAFTIQNPEAAEKLASLTGKEKTDYYNEQLQKMWRNKAVSDTYEPAPHLRYSPWLWRLRKMCAS